MENCLNNGFLKAKNNNKMKFYVMWANHDANYTWDKRISNLQSCNVWEGKCDATQFKIIARRLIEQYFLHPLYYKIKNKPVNVPVCVPSQEKWTQKSFKKRNESQYFVGLRKPTAFIPRFA